jgi:hypothetical protein
VHNFQFYGENLAMFLDVATKMAAAFVGAVLLLGLVLFLVQ